ncbi:hypothetical protein HY489_04810 [Candidatus Woesearchaeota archaeon]|nr:hypothetical protein [Candidatus Woesearchaeota archaeon]
MTVINSEFAQEWKRYHGTLREVTADYLKALADKRDEHLRGIDDLVGGNESEIDSKEGYVNGVRDVYQMFAQGIGEQLERALQELDVRRTKLVYGSPPEAPSCYRDCEGPIDEATQKAQNCTKYVNYLSFIVKIVHAKGSRPDRKILEELAQYSSNDRQRLISERLANCSRYDRSKLLLSFHEREMLTMFYGISDGYRYTLEEIARIFKTKPDYVKRRKEDALKKIAAIPTVQSVNENRLKPRVMGQSIPSQEEQKQIAHKLACLLFDAYQRPQERYKNILLEKDLSEISPFLDTVLKCFTFREKEIIKMSYGLTVERTYTNKEISNIFKVTSGRIGQIKKKALEKIKKFTPVEELEALLR